MPITIDYGNCAACHERNSHHAQQCRSCGADLPWKRHKRGVPHTQPLGGQPTGTPSAGASSSASGAQPTPPMPNTANSRPTTPLIGDGWYYADAGTRLGPFDAGQIMDLITAGKLTLSTMVWRPGLQDWCAANISPLSPLFAAVSTVPPPLTGDAVSNSVIWAVAFAPLMGAFLAVCAGAATNSAASNFWWITLLLNICLCVADEKALKNAGHDTKGMGGWTFLVPIYLFVRAQRLNQAPNYAYVWIVMFIISLAL